MYAFHSAKDSGNFVQNSNIKVRFGFFRPEYSGSPLEVVHSFRSEYSDRDSPFHFILMPVRLFCFVSLAVLFVSARVLSAAVHDLILRY